MVNNKIVALVTSKQVELSIRGLFKKYSTFFLSSQQGMSELLVQSVAAHIHIHASSWSVSSWFVIHFFLCKAFSAGE